MARVLGLAYAQPKRALKSKAIGLPLFLAVQGTLAQRSPITVWDVGLFGIGELSGDVARARPRVSR
jgi:hypothetical protein